MSASAPPSIRAGVPLRDLTTFRVGGPCRQLVDCATPEQVHTAIRSLGATEPYVVLGGGSNIVAADAGYAGTVVRYCSPTPHIEFQAGRLNVTGGTLLDALVETAVEAGCAGLAFASGIPGTVGGAIAGNAGAFGRAMADVVLSVRVMDRAGRVRDVPADELEFGYRRSRLQTSGEIVLSSSFLAPAARSSTGRQERADILALRREKHPDWRQIPNAGSFFRNLEQPGAARRLAAGKLLEEAGAKGLRVGGAAVFDRHANILINASGDCAARDILELARQMAAAVRAKFGVRLQREVRLLGFPAEPVE